MPVVPSRRRWWCAAAVALVAGVAYAPSFGNLYTLDDVLVVTTRFDRGQAPLSTLFDADYFARYNQDTYRPVATLSSMFDHRLGIDPRLAGRAQNILWHAGTALLVVLFASRFLSLGAAVVSGLFFAVHPVATEATLAIGYREDAMVAFFVAAALLLTWPGGRLRRALALACYVLALFTKEHAFVFPALLLLARLALQRGDALDRRALVRELAAFGLVSIGYLIVRFGVMASPDEFADPVGGTYLGTLVAVPRIFAHDLRLLVVPWPQLVLYAHMFPFGASFVSQLPWLLFDVALVVGAARIARIRPVLGFGLLWSMLALAPTLHFLPMRVAAADRFVHLSLLGAALAAGALFALAAEAPLPAVRRAAQATAAVALLALLALTERRIPVWHDEVALWKDTLRHNANAYHGHFFLAAKHEADGRLERARLGYVAAVATCPRESRFGRTRFCAYFAGKLGFLLLRRGDVTAARAAFDESLGFYPDFAPAFVGIGHLRLAERDVDGARQFAARAKACDARNPVVRDMLAELDAAIDRTAQTAPRDD